MKDPSIGGFFTAVSSLATINDVNTEKPGQKGRTHQCDLEPFGTPNKITSGRVLSARSEPTGSLFRGVEATPNALNRPMTRSAARQNHPMADHLDERRRGSEARQPGDRDAFFRSAWSCCPGLGQHSRRRFVGGHTPSVVVRPATTLKRGMSLSWGVVQLVSR